MSTRKRSTFSNPSSPPKSALPPPRRRKATAKDKTTLPLSNVRFNTFVYILSGLALAFIVFNVWRLLQLKTAAGGWWNLALGRRPHGTVDDEAAAHGHEAGTGKGGESGVEDRINGLAEALGMPSHELASAIADAVKHHVPLASLSSISASEATQSGTAVNILVDKGEEELPGMRLGDKLSAMAGFDGPGLEMD